MTRRGAAIVIPAYGAPEALSACLDAVLAHLDPARDRVLVVNDAGPLAGEIERVVLAAAGDVEYVRNPANLGFVGTCNRALALIEPGLDLLVLNSDTVVDAGFLDELSAVLHADDRNGCVAPRSDNATIASLPYSRRHPHQPRSRERTLEVFAALRDELPRQSVTPISPGFCLLIRRELIDAHGLFDPAFSPGYGEEVDFCLRMAALGHRSLLAHRVLVLHAGESSFGRRRARSLRFRHRRLIAARHPRFAGELARYLQNERDAVDRFADILTPGGGPPKIAVDPSTWRSRARDLTGILEAADAAVRAGRCTVTVFASGWRATRLRRAHPALRVLSASHDDSLHDAELIGPDAGDAELVHAHRRAARWYRDGGAELFGAAVAEAGDPHDLVALRARDTEMRRLAELGPDGYLRRLPLRSRIVASTPPAVVDRVRAVVRR